MMHVILCSDAIVMLIWRSDGGLMKSTRLQIGLLLCVLLLIVAAVVVLRSPDRRSARLRSPELEYLKTVNSVAPPRDPELMFILMGEFASSNLQDEGAEFFSA